MQPSIRFHPLQGRSTSGYVTWGAPWPKGAVSPESGFRLEDGVALQSKIVAYWPDGSAKWSVHTARCPQDHVSLTAEQSQDPIPPSGIRLRKRDGELHIDTDVMRAVVPVSGNTILREARTGSRVFASNAVLRLLLEERSFTKGREVHSITAYTGETRSISVEEEGPLKVTLRLEGVHKHEATGREAFPFILRLTFHHGESEIGLVHTFLFDGDENREFMRGIGVTFNAPLEGECCNRNICFATDHGYFSESAQLLLSWRPPLPRELYEAQQSGRQIAVEDDLRAVLEQMPVWSEYRLSQSGSGQFSIQKGTGKPGCCRIHCLQGHRAKGLAAVGGINGGVAVAYRDFWQRCPTAFHIEAAEEEQARMTVWIWPPEAEPMDFRHYDDRGYSQTYYEGFDDFGAEPKGIACTSRFSIQGFCGGIPETTELDILNHRTQKPPMLVAEPAYYHAVHAFGRWSLPQTETPEGLWIEKQLDGMLDFYLREVDVRNWYGLFNYGDVMHTYDGVRHDWRYDMGGYAWQNTELVPTYWLWYVFLRSGREDVFSMAEAMTFHCSEVDIYHIGKYRGLGSRHNVRHWGCPCKEPRIAMAGHNRFYAYLTGDLRTLEIMDEVRDADASTIETDPLRKFYDKAAMRLPTHARTGPDWAAYCSNWMTFWERWRAEAYREKMITGIEDIARAPLRLISGADYEYDPVSGHLGYIGEQTTGGSHLSLCMGSTEVWIEMTELLGSDKWTEMVAEYGRFYFLPSSEQQTISNGLVGQREFSLPFMASAIGLFAAHHTGDAKLGRAVWKVLIGELLRVAPNGFQPTEIPNAGNQKRLREISWISTNTVSQWCLNAIVGMEFYPPDGTEDVFARKS